MPNLLKTGLLANNHAAFPKHDHRSVAAAGIQERRSQMDVPCGPGGKVHDYVPLYFGSLSPMLLGVINAGEVSQTDFLYFEFPIDLVADDTVVFTDASANTAIPPNFFHDPADLAKLDWEAIDSLKWKDPSDEARHRRMAELLVYGSLPLSAAINCVVCNDEKKLAVEGMVASVGAKFPRICFEQHGRYHWFKQNIDGKWTNYSLKAKKST